MGGTLRWEKALEVPNYSLSHLRPCVESGLGHPYSSQGHPCSSRGPPRILPSSLHLPAPPSGLEALALPEDKTEQGMMLGLRSISPGGHPRANMAPPPPVSTLQKELWENAGRAMKEQQTYRFSLRARPPWGALQTWPESGQSDHPTHSSKVSHVTYKARLTHLRARLARSPREARAAWSPICSRGALRRQRGQGRKGPCLSTPGLLEEPRLFFMWIPHPTGPQVLLQVEQGGREMVSSS